MTRLSFSALLFSLLLLSSCASQYAIHQKTIVSDDIDYTVLEHYKLILHFWSPRCFTCLPELDMLKQMQPWLEQHGFKIVAVGVYDSKESIEKVVSSKALSFSIVADVDSRFVERYAIETLPQSLIFLDAKANKPHYTLEGPQEWGSAEFQRKLLADNFSSRVDK